jgi:putative membrane protein
MNALMAVIAAVSLMADPAAAPPAAPGLNDPQVATVVLTAHQIDIDRGKLAQKKAKTAEVKQFADQMVTDHTQGLNEVKALAKKLKVKPQESDVTKSLKAEAADKMLVLKKLDGADFEKAYIDTEVGYHEAVVAAIDQALLPAAKNEEVKTALTNARPTIVSHLEHARGVQKLVSGGGAEKPAEKK